MAKKVAAKKKTGKAEEAAPKLRKVGFHLPVDVVKMLDRERARLLEEANGGGSRAAASLSQLVADAIREKYGR